MMKMSGEWWAVYTSEDSKPDCAAILVRKLTSREYGQCGLCERRRPLRFPFSVAPLSVRRKATRADPSFVAICADLWLILRLGGCSERN